MTVGGVGLAVELGPNEELYTVGHTDAGNVFTVRRIDDQGATVSTSGAPAWEQYPGTVNQPTKDTTAPASTTVAFEPKIRTDVDGNCIYVIGGGGVAETFILQASDGTTLGSINGNAGPRPTCSAPPPTNPNYFDDSVDIPEKMFTAYDQASSSGINIEAWELVSKTLNNTTTTVTAATISFASSDNSVNDSANGLAGFTAGERLVVNGSTDNDKSHTIVTVAAGKLTLDEDVNTVVDEAAGATITLSTPARPRETRLVGISDTNIRVLTTFANAIGTGDGSGEGVLDDANATIITCSSVTAMPRTLLRDRRQIGGLHYAGSANWSHR